MNNVLEEIIFKLDEGDIIITDHSRVKLFRNNIDTISVKSSIRSSEVLEIYEDDFPCPSCLLLVKIKDEYYHLVVANCKDHVRLVTIYHPYESKWEDYRRRKKS